MQVENSVEAPEIELQVNTLDNLFKERDTLKPYEPEEKEEQVAPAEKKKSSEKVVTKATEKEPLDSKVVKETKIAEKKAVDDDIDEEKDERSVELEKLKKALNDSQKWGHTNNKRLKNVTKIIESMRDSDTITEDEFSKLSELLTTDQEEDEQQAISANSHPISSLILSANKRIPDLKDLYDNDGLFDKKTDAFNKLISNSTPEEIDDILEELEDVKGSDLKLAKKLYEIGERFYNEFYKDLEESGGLRKLVESKNTKLKNMQLKIDKLEKKLSEYNDYDKPTNRIDELGDVSDSTTAHKPNDVLGQLFNERDRKKR